MIRSVWLCLLLLGSATFGFAQETSVPIEKPTGQEAGAVGITKETPVEPKVYAVNNADQAWLLTSCALVLFMTPGLAFFYGGLVGRKNILSVLMQCFMCMALVSVLWVLVGFSMAFSTDQLAGGFVGNPLTFFLLNNVSESKAWAPFTVSEQAFMAFQMMFAIITPGLIVGAFAERMKFQAFMLFLPLWSLIVYAPVAHWVWSGPDGLFGLGAFIPNGQDGEGTPIGALDFAGGTVVHINAGIAALVCCLVVGPRRNYPNQVPAPHNLPFAVLGAGMLWFGWFGFNAGSALGSGDQAVRAFVTTHIAAAVAGLTWSLIEFLKTGRATMLGMITGAVAGLVAITPAAGFVDVKSALIIGIGATIISYVFVAIVKPALKYDDSLDVFGVHGMAGIWGAIATGIFALPTFGLDRAGGLINGNTGQLLLQLKAVGFTVVYSGIVSFILLKLVDFTVGLRCTDDSEKMGLDLSDHAETAYTIS